MCPPQLAAHPPPGPPIRASDPRCAGLGHLAMPWWEGRRPPAAIGAGCGGGGVGERGGAGGGGRPRAPFRLPRGRASRGSGRGRAPPPPRSDSAAPIKAWPDPLCLLEARPGAGRERYLGPGRGGAAPGEGQRPHAAGKGERSERRAPRPLSPPARTLTSRPSPFPPPPSQTRILVHVDIAHELVVSAFEGVRVGCGRRRGSRLLPWPSPSFFFFRPSRPRAHLSFFFFGEARAPGAATPAASQPRPAGRLAQSVADLPLTARAGPFVCARGAPAPGGRGKAAKKGARKSASHRPPALTETAPR